MLATVFRVLDTGTYLASSATPNPGALWDTPLQHSQCHRQESHCQRHDSYFHKAKAHMANGCILTVRVDPWVWTKSCSDEDNRFHACSVTYVRFPYTSPKPFHIRQKVLDIRCGGMHPLTWASPSRVKKQLLAFCKWSSHAQVVD